MYMMQFIVIEAFSEIDNAKLFLFKIFEVFFSWCFELDSASVKLIFEFN